VIDSRGFSLALIRDFWAAGFCGRGRMPAAVGLRPDWDAKRVRAAARKAKDADQARRLLAIAAAYEGQDRTTAAKIGAMDPQRLRDWVRRFNAAGPDGLIDRKPAGAARRLTPEQEAELAALIEAGPDVERDRVVRWRCVDLQQLILTRWNIAFHERTIGKLLRRLGFSHISARPRHLGQDPARIEEFKKTLPNVWAKSRQSSPQRHP
jgi:putative transposase